MDILEKLGENVFIPNIDSAEKLPDGKGIYLICSKNIINLPDLMKNLDYQYIDGNPIIYVGISKKQGLKSRDYKNHFTGSARNSTLRKSLGVLFDYEKYYYKDGKYRFVIEHEKHLSDWMKENLLLYYYTTNEKLDEIEVSLIKLISPPLNLKDNHALNNLEFRIELLDLRRNNHNTK